MDVGTQFSQYAPGGGRGAMRCGHNCKLRKSLLVFNVARRLHLSRQNHGRLHRGVAPLPPPRRGHRAAGFPCLTPPGPPPLAASGCPPRAGMAEPTGRRHSDDRDGCRGGLSLASACSSQAKPMRSCSRRTRSPRRSLRNASNSVRSGGVSRFGSPG